MNTIAVPPSNISVPPIELGLRYTWESAPNWWNPTGERVNRLKEDKAWLDYWASPLPISALKTVWGSAKR